MNGERKQQAWETFEDTGAIGAYLVYCALCEEEKHPLRGGEQRK